MVLILRIFKCFFSAPNFEILAATLWWFTAAPQPLKIQVLGVTQPPGVVQPYILGDTTRPGHVTCILVRSKSGRRQLRKTLHKQTDRQTLRKWWSLGREPTMLLVLQSGLLLHIRMCLCSQPVVKNYSPESITISCADFHLKVCCCIEELLPILLPLLTGGTLHFRHSHHIWSDGLPRTGSGAVIK